MILPATNPAEALFKAYCESYQKRDLNGILALCAKNINLWGTGLDEYRVGLKEAEEQLLRDWQQSDAARLEIVKTVPAPEGALWYAAVCNAVLTVDGVEHTFHDLRGTITVEKEDGKWKISHMHASFPDFRNPENGSFPV